VEDATSAVAEIFADDLESFRWVAFELLGLRGDDLQEAVVNCDWCGGTAWSHVVLGVEGE